MKLLPILSPIDPALTQWLKVIFKDGEWNSETMALVFVKLAELNHPLTEQQIDAMRQYVDVLRIAVQFLEVWGTADDQLELHQVVYLDTALVKISAVELGEKQLRMARTFDIVCHGILNYLAQN